MLHEHLCLYRIRNNDKARLTNKLEGWESAVSYINQKHGSLIAQLPKSYQTERKRMIAADGFYRACKSAGIKERLGYALTAFRCKPDLYGLKLIALSFPVIEKLNQYRKRQ